MLTTLLELALAPALVGAASVAGRRWHAAIGGVISAFPAIVGPLLVVAADAHGEAFAARTATGTLAGLASFAAFVLVYARLGRDRAWAVALGGAWLAAAAVTAALGLRSPSLAPALVLGAGSLTLAYLLLPPAPRAVLHDPLAPTSVPMRMLATFALVVLLAAVAARAGAFVGGLLAALPVLASVLAVATHRRQGSAAMLALLRGMLAGMGAFVAFCAAVAALAVPLTAPPAFALALAAALVVATGALSSQRA